MSIFLLPIAKWSRNETFRADLLGLKEWYKKFYTAKPQESMYEFCTKQIAEYAEKAKKRNLNCADKRATQL